MTMSTQAKKAFFALDEEFASAEYSKVLIVPVPYEQVQHNDASCLWQAPDIIMAASQSIELFDDELWTEPYRVGIHTCEPVEMALVTSGCPKPFAELQNAIAPLIEFNKFPIAVGGNHAITLGAVKACVDRYEDLSVLQIDAKANCHSSSDNPFSEACASYQVYNALPRPIMTQVGIRSISSSEVQWMESEKPRINIFWARNQDRWNFNEIVHTLSDNVYLSINLCGLDPAVMPAVSDPQPGGMSWYQLMELIKQVCIKRNLIAADVVGLARMADTTAPAALAARLIYKLIGYRYALDLGVSKKYL